MTSEHEIEDLEYQIQKMFERFGLVGTRFAPGEFDFRIAEKAPQASTVSIRVNVSSLRNKHKTNIATVVGVVSKSNAECKAPRSDYGHIQLTDTHFSTEGEYCYFHYNGEHQNLNKLTSEVKLIIRDLVKEHKRRKK